MPALRTLRALRTRAGGIWKSRRSRLCLAAFVLLLLSSLGLGSALLQRRPQVAEVSAPEEEIELELDASGEWVAGRLEALPPPLPPTTAAPPATPAPSGPAREVNAAWYDVPDDSLAKRRAGKQELTAAHNRLPIGTRLRVTHLANGRSTVVRITDRGIRDRKVKLDVCREAAEELGMLRKGIARVRIEILQEEGGSSLTESYTAAPQP